MMIDNIITTSSPAACDKPGNHIDGLHVLFFDSHTEFAHDAGSFVGAGGGTSVLEKELQYLDAGD